MTFQTLSNNRFIMLLAYYRLYITYTLAGFLFDLDQSTIYIDIQKIEELIRKCLPILQKTYCLTKRLKTLEEIEKYFIGVKSFVDCTEQQISRLVYNNRRRIFFSGEKKRHTIKT
ncbi:MAG TPA: transposase family protein [Candidatus Nitrosocosmicus sp.]